MWKSFKSHVWKFLGALISDTKPDGQVAVSLGRVCFLAVLIYMFIFWQKNAGTDVQTPDGLMEVFYVLAGYVFGSKAVDTVRGHLNGRGSAAGDYPPDE